MARTIVVNIDADTTAATSNIDDLNASIRETETAQNEATGAVEENTEAVEENMEMNQGLGNTLTTLGGGVATRMVRAFRGITTAVRGLTASQALLLLPLTALIAIFAAVRAAFTRSEEGQQRLMVITCLLYTSPSPRDS